VKIVFHDVNGFASKADPKLVKEVDDVLRAMPLQVKLSDQANRTDRLIFSPVASNAHIGKALTARGWTAAIPFPDTHQALGIGGDYGKGGILLEAQFSNYPFLLNNVVRTNVLYNAQLPLAMMGPIEAAIIVTKGKLFDAANSTLYYEQAVQHVEFMVKGNSVQVPLRLIGLMADRGIPQRARLVEYHAKRYSRTLIKSAEVLVQVGSPGQIRERERITLLKPK
jgi:hypothetical protein